MPNLRQFDLQLDSYNSACKPNGGRITTKLQTTFEMQKVNQQK
jgi:hypothetical protein